MNFGNFFVKLIDHFDVPKLTHDLEISEFIIFLHYSVLQDNQFQFTHIFYGIILLRYENFELISFKIK